MRVDGLSGAVMRRLEECPSKRLDRGLPGPKRFTESGLQAHPTLFFAVGVEFRAGRAGRVGVSANVPPRRPKKEAAPPSFISLRHLPRPNRPELRLVENNLS